MGCEAAGSRPTLVGSTHLRLGNDLARAPASHDAYACRVADGSSPEGSARDCDRAVLGGTRWREHPCNSELIVTKGTIALLRICDMSYKIMQMARPNLGTLELATLLAVARFADDAYGAAVRHDLSERTGRDHSVGAVYTTLQRLEDKGLLTSHASDPIPVRGGRSRRLFRITGAGARAIREAEREAVSMWAGVGSPIRPQPA